MSEEQKAEATADGEGAEASATVDHNAEQGAPEEAGPKDHNAEQTGGDPPASGDGDEE